MISKELTPCFLQNRNLTMQKWELDSSTLHQETVR
jgi:hypothetical protein